MSDLGGGTINTDEIGAARGQMLEILNKFRGIQERIVSTQQTLCEDWVGEGRNEFQTQYRLLLSKISDIGDSLEDMYNVLAEAEKEYGDTDSSIRQEIVMSMQDTEFTINVPDPSK